MLVSFKQKYFRIGVGKILAVEGKILIKSNDRSSKAVENVTTNLSIVVPISGSAILGLISSKSSIVSSTPKLSSSESLILTVLNSFIGAGV